MFGTEVLKPISELIYSLRFGAEDHTEESSFEEAL